MASVFISHNEEVDIKTFTEKKDKPYLLPHGEDPQIDALRYFHSEMTGHILDMAYQFLKSSRTVQDGSKRNRRFRRETVESEDSIDNDYI